MRERKREIEIVRERGRGGERESRVEVKKILYFVELL